MKRTALLLCLALMPVAAQQARLAETPPMGWNSWDSYGLSVSEREFKANAVWLAQHLKRYGWQYAVVDEGWYLNNPEAKPETFQFTVSKDGRYLPAVNRFPSAANGAGFKPLADWVHAQGLKFGIHIIRGIPKQAVAKNLKIAGSPYTAEQAANQSDTCPWNADNYGVKAAPAGQAYYDSVAALYAGWGVDFVKIDCIAAHPYKGDEIRMVSEALRKSGRPIVLSLSPGPSPLDKADELRRWANLWRISDDIWDHWLQWPQAAFSQGLLRQFTNTAEWAPHVEPAHWPDADMLPLGHLGPRPGFGKDRPSAFTHDEERTLVTLWSIFRSPLIMGGNLTAMDAFTTSLLTNSEVIAVDQNSTGGRQVVNDGRKAVWLAKADGGKTTYVALFNLAGEQQTIEYPLQPLGLGAGVNIRDLWEKKDLGNQDVLRVALRPHASGLYQVK